MLPLLDAPAVVVKTNKLGDFMRLYDYQCKQCRTIFEVRASFQEKEQGLNPVCPNCQSTETRQLLSVGLFMRSGSDDPNSQSSSCCGPNSGPGCCGG